MSISVYSLISGLPTTVNNLEHDFAVIFVNQLSNLDMGFDEPVIIDPLAFQRAIPFQMNSQITTISIIMINSYPGIVHLLLY